MFLVFAGSAFLMHSQNDQNQVLMTVDGSPVYTNEFKQVYLKNIELVDKNQRDIASYLDLFKKYKLKLQEAYALGFDKRPQLKQELEGYKEQLAQNYMTDAPATEALIKEAYEHMVEEVKVSHIMISLQNATTPQDTLKAWNAINDIRKQLLQGADFKALAIKKSEDPSVRNNYGDLGWFDAFKMVYPFEEAAYNTPVGEISPIIKTRFGYHILKTTDKRKSKGEVQVAHILISYDQNDETVDIQQRINDIYQKLKQGESFESLAERYSDDRITARMGGKLNRFGAGGLNSDKFVQVAFSLKEPEEITEPFESELGWHIIKLIQKYPVGSFDELHAFLENKVRNDARGQLAEMALIEKLKKLYEVKEFPEVVTYFSQHLDSSLDEKSGSNSALIIEDQINNYQDFGLFLKQKNQADSKPVSENVQSVYEDYINQSLKKYYKEHLAETNSDYAQIIKEYEEGILLFALMEEKIWNRAKEDTVGLRKYFESKRSNYQWPERYDVLVATAPNLQSAERAQKMLEKGKTIEEIKTELNTDGLVNIFFTKRTATADDEVLPLDYDPKTGVSPVYKGDEYTVVVLNDVLPSQQKQFNEIKGKVINDYQQELEAQWLEQLESEHEIEVNESIFEEIKKELSR